MFKGALPVPSGCKAADYVALLKPSP